MADFEPYRHKLFSLQQELQAKQGAGRLNFDPPLTHCLNRSK